MRNTEPLHRIHRLSHGEQLSNMYDQSSIMICCMIRILRVRSVQLKSVVLLVRFLGTDRGPFEQVWRRRSCYGPE